MHSILVGSWQSGYQTRFLAFMFMGRVEFGVGVRVSHPFLNFSLVGIVLFAHSICVHLVLSKDLTLVFSLPACRVW